MSSEILTSLLRLRSSTSRRGSLYNWDFHKSLQLVICAVVTYGLGEVLEAIIAQVKVFQHGAFFKLVWDVPYVVIIKLQAGIKVSSCPRFV